MPPLAECCGGGSCTTRSRLEFEVSTAPSPKPPTADLTRFYAQHRWTRRDAWAGPAPCRRTRGRFSRSGEGAFQQAAEPALQAAPGREPLTQAPAGALRRSAAAEEISGLPCPVAACGARHVPPVRVYRAAGVGCRRGPLAGSLDHQAGASSRMQACACMHSGCAGACMYPP